MFANSNHQSAKTPVADKPARVDAAEGKETKDLNPIWSSLALNPLYIQPKLAVSQPDDPYEQEADRVAERVMRMPSPRVQRKCESCSSESPCEECKPKEDLVQLKADNGSGQARDTSQLPGNLGTGRPLDRSVRSFFEPRFGANFSSVQVHTDQQASESAKALNAQAFAYGNHLVFAEGRYEPDSSEGKQLLAHELTHIVQQPGHIARNGDPQTSNCHTGIPVGSAQSRENDHFKGPSGTYYIWGPPYTDEDAVYYADLSIQAWIIWRFRTVSPAVASRIRAEATRWPWRWYGSSPPVRGCQYHNAMAMSEMNRLVALANRDPAARQAESREGRAGMPALPPPEPIADFEVTVRAAPDPPGSSPTPPPPTTPTPPRDTRAEAERALDPTSIYEAGAPGANAPPFPARIDGPEMEVPRGVGTFSMVLDYAATTSDPLMQMAYHLNAVNYHWELFNITGIVRAGMGSGMEEEVRRMGQTMPQSAQASEAASGASAQRTAHAREQLRDETIRSWDELRSPRRAAEGGSAVDVVTRTYANALNLYLLPASAIISAGGSALGALADLAGAYSQEREIPFPSSQGFYMVRCVAQPAPRGPNRSEIRAASVRSKIVEVRAPEMLARSALDVPEASIAMLELQKRLTSDPAEIQRLDAQIASIRQQVSGDLVEYLERLVREKQQAHDAAPTWQRSRLRRELDALRLRLEQARRNREGTRGSHHRPRAAFTSIVTGETYPLMLELSEMPVENGFRVRLMDLTVPDREPIERNGASLEQAVRNAFNELAFHGDLGRGQLEVRMPATWTGEPRQLSLQTGDASTAIVRRRLQDLATALLVLSLVVPGVGEVSAVIMAGLAVDRLLRRGMNGTLRFDAEAISDTLAILGAVAQGAQLIGRLRVVRAGNSFIAAARTSDQAALLAAARTLDTARRAQRILDATSTITNVGGLLWGDAVAIGRLAQIQQDEVDGVITHADARRQRAELIGAAIRDHGILMAGVLRPQRPASAGAGGEGAPTTPRETPPTTPREAPPATPREAPPPTPRETPPATPGETRPPTPPAETAPPPRPAETIQEPELERRATQAQRSGTAGETQAPPPSNGVRSRFRTPDGLHEIFILNDGRIFRCSLTCAQLRTWYGTYLTSQPAGTRRQTATALEAELGALETRAAGGENTPELNQAIANLDARMREFISPDVATELQRSFESRGLIEPGQQLLTPEETHNLLRVYSLDSLVDVAGNTQSAYNLRLLADIWGDVLRNASPTDVVRLRTLNERIRPTDEQLDALRSYFENRRDVMDGAIRDLEAAQNGAELLRIAQRDPIIPVGIDAGVANAVDAMLTRFRGRNLRLNAGLTALLREHLRRNAGGLSAEAIAAIANPAGLLTALRTTASARVTSTSTAPGPRDPRYQHAVSGHGSARDPDGMRSEAASRRGTGRPQGQFYNDATIVDADAMALPPGDIRTIVDFGTPIGRVFMIDGSVVSDVTRVLVVRNGESFDAYPVDPTYRLPP